MIPRGLPRAPPRLRQLFPAKPWRSNRNKAPEGTPDTAPYPPCWLRASLATTGFEIFELCHVRLTHKVDMQGLLAAPLAGN